jgi:type III restriction enzyme
MANVVIQNPILNSPYREPSRHWRFSDDGITDEVVESRRVSAYFIPIAQPRSRGAGGQLTLQGEWTSDRIEENRFINQVRRNVATWRSAGWPHVTRTTHRLLEWWTIAGRDRPLFFCQIEALETAIYILEAAPRLADAWLDTELRQAADSSNPGLHRVAFKMATGSGKTLVMAMLIAWQTLNKLVAPQDARFSDAFLVVTPGITIRDRLRVLLPNDVGNYYRSMSLVPGDLQEQLHQARVVVTNFHAFMPRERVAAGRLTKAMLGKAGSTGAFTESPAHVARRVCRDLGGRRSIVVLNDEAHHCYRHRIQTENERLSGDDRRDAEQREEAARIWLNGLLAVKEKIGLRAVYDLSATPFFLRGSGYPEGTLFPWVVSDFSLIDAIESGIVKIPRVPVADNAMAAGMPTYRDLWRHIREHLPHQGRRTAAVRGEPVLPKELEGALKALYGNYAVAYRRWESDPTAPSRAQTPPVFIIVCNNTNVSKLVYDYIAGWERTLPDGTSVLVPGALDIFSNVHDGRWLSRPNTILIDSEQLESGDAMKPEFKKLAAREIDEFKSEYRLRFPGRDPDALTDEDLLREVMNTVGKPGRLGEQIRCVVSVSMLTEGWDATTVTHILGVRAFGTQLLCEQVVGRGLRRSSYTPNPDGLFSPEYAEVYGVPFSFIPCSGSIGDPPAPRSTTRVRALEERSRLEITFPRLAGYRWDLPRHTLSAEFGPDTLLLLSTEDVPTRVENEPIVGVTSVHTLDELRAHREQEVAFHLASRLMDSYFRSDDGRMHWLFPQLLTITRRWMAECLACKDDAFPQLLLLAQIAHDASDRIYRSIVASQEGGKIVQPILEPYDMEGSTRFVDFDTTRPVMNTDPRYCHVTHVVADTGSWEQKTAQALEELGEEGILACYVKNQNLGFSIPYHTEGTEHRYVPDFIARLDDGQGSDNLLNLIIEVTGERDAAKQAKVDTARSLWVPAVNNHGGFGRWSFIEIRDPWNAKSEVRALLEGNR